MSPAGDRPASRAPAFARPQVRRSAPRACARAGQRRQRPTSTQCCWRRSTIPTPRCARAWRAGSRRGRGGAYDPATWPAPPGASTRAWHRRRSTCSGWARRPTAGSPSTSTCKPRCRAPRCSPCCAACLGDPADLADPHDARRAFALTSEWIEAPVVAALVEDLAGAGDGAPRRRGAGARLAAPGARLAPRQALPGLLAHPSPRIVRRGVALAMLLGPAAQDAARALRRHDRGRPAPRHRLRRRAGPHRRGARGPGDARRPAPLAPGQSARRCGYSLPAALAKLGRRGVPLLVEGLGLGSPVAELCLAEPPADGPRRVARRLPALRERASRRPQDQALAAAHRRHRRPRSALPPPRVTVSVKAPPERHVLTGARFCRTSRRPAASSAPPAAPARHRMAAGRCTSARPSATALRPRGRWGA